MDSKKLISFREVSLVLTGNKNTVRSNRINSNYSKPINELLVFLDKWVEKNGINQNAKVTIKTPDDMARIKSRRQLQEEAQARSYCKEHSVSEISLVLKHDNNHRLWNRPKHEWSVLDWEEYLEFKNQIQSK